MTAAKCPKCDGDTHPEKQGEALTIKHKEGCTMDKAHKAVKKMPEVKLGRIFHSIAEVENWGKVTLPDMADELEKVWFHFRPEAVKVNNHNSIEGTQKWGRNFALICLLIDEELETDEQFEGLMCMFREDIFV